jgi:hypothetical protein
MTNGKDFINDMMGQMTGDKKYDKETYHCWKCEAELERIVVQTAMKEPRKLFFFALITNANGYGLYTTVASTRKK